MKKKLLISLGSLIAVGIAAFGTTYLLSLHKVSFTLRGNPDNVTIYAASGEKKKVITADSHMFLKKGEYYAVPEGKNIAQDKIRFTVQNKDMTVVVDPSYSKEYLSVLTSKEEPAVSAAIARKYPSLFPTSYTLEKGTLYEKGDWFGGLLAPKISDIRERKDPYRIILHKQNGAWEVVRRPEYILTSSKYDGVPIDVLRAVNLLAE